MTALVTAADGGGMAPDLILPPGFDRVGEVIHFEQASRKSAERRAEVVRHNHHGADPCKGERATLSPATDRREPAEDGGLRAYTTDAAERPGRIGLPGAVASEAVSIEDIFAAGEEGSRPHKRTWRMTRADLVPCTRCGLRGHVAGDPERCLAYRGSFGLGGQAAQAAEQGQWSNRTKGA